MQWKKIKITGINPGASPGLRLRPQGRSMIPMLIQDNSICKFQFTAFLKLESHYLPIFGTIPLTDMIAWCL